MAGGAAVLAAVMFASLTVPASPTAPVVDVDPRDATVLPNHNISVLCNVGVPIYFCRFEIHGIPTRVLQPNVPKDEYGVSYFGSGFETGQCGVKIERVQLTHNGIMNCSMGISGISHEAAGSMALTVAQSPMSPELQVDTGRRGSYDYYEGDQLKAFCRILNGRPVANISWFLGDHPLREGLSMPPSVESSGNDTFTISQNLTRTLSWADNGKSLRCVASHIALAPDSEQSLLQLNVEFPPKPIQQNIGVEQHDIEAGKGKSVQLEIYANPKPNIRWKLGNGEEVREGRSDTSGNFEVENTADKGMGKWETKLSVHSVNDEILKADYQVTAQNMHGKEVYHISLTASGQSDALLMGTGLIIGIVIAVVLIILIIFLVIHARATGRWCFAGGHPARNEKESESLTATALERELNVGELDSGYLPTNCMVANGAQTNERSDTESADQGPLSGHKKKSPAFQLPNFFKKKDKVSADPESLTQEAQLQDHEVSLTEKKGINNECMKVPAANPDGIVYAELDLQAGRRSIVVRSEDEKTEYAEILHNTKRDDEVEISPTE